MEGDLWEGGHGGGGGDDAEVMAGLSTVLVATIQEVKDRISHIEFIFCSQLFPRIRSRSRRLQKQISVEEDWRRKEASLLRQVEEFRLQKEKAEEETMRMAVSLEREKAEKAEMARILAKLESAERISETAIADVREECRQLQEKLQRQIDQKDLELSEETFRRKQLAKSWTKLEERYKHLKSQYRFLLRKAGLVAEISDGTDGERGSPISISNPPPIPQNSPSLLLDEYRANRLVPVDPKTIRDPRSTPVAPMAEEESGVLPARGGSIRSRRSTGSMEPARAAGPRSTRSPWVDTRGRREAGGVDPHDDFLDTPMEAVRGRRSGQSPGDEPSSHESEGEIKEMDAAAAAETSIQKPHGGVWGFFKYVEPVRKKAERENLKGVECRQCEKFYDAVLPGGRDGRSSAGDVRCEHHEGVSRHRYRHAPPMTPEGFWNIGFDSET
ncbi:unnamed protein product [Spirodela intermedia]|uniref:DNA endonuclease activator Ctp1 C-terminal domain-containing protein n=1 Tax=Spirodela intermedia TaxID=51605 RepID=A0A7I8LJV8_SPIIN|nr:unnamed protein product [Spirodela intermedia]